MMIVALLLWGVVALIMGLGFIAAAKSAIHEIEAALSFLIATVAFGCAGIMAEIKSSRNPPKPAAAETANENIW